MKQLINRRNILIALGAIAISTAAFAGDLWKLSGNLPPEEINVHRLTLERGSYKIHGYGTGWGDLDLAIYDDDQDLVVADRDGDNTPVVYITVPSKQDVFILPSNADTNDSIRYEVYVSED